MPPYHSLSSYANGPLSPLPTGLRHGLATVSFFGFLSFFTTAALLVFLTLRLIRWRHQQGGYNQFILLIYNLIFADMQQAIAFLINSRWAGKNALEAGTSACFAQGWFISVGQLGTGVWIFTIAVHTFAAVIMDYKLGRIQFALTVAGLWVFIYLMAIIGVAAHPGDIYMRAGAWCWISQKYAPLRLWLHYFWIFISMFGTLLIYLSIYVLLQRRLKSRYYSSAHAQEANAAARYMVIYPFAYVLCTLPIAAGRMHAMTGRSVPYAYYIFAGTMITSNGWLDVLLYALTRRAIVFSDAPPPEACGLETFGGGWSRNGFGNRVIIESGFQADGEGGKKVLIETAGGVQRLELVGAVNDGRGFKTTTVIIESHRRPIAADLEAAELPAKAKVDKEDPGWDSESTSSV